MSIKFFDRYPYWLHVVGWVGFIGLPLLMLPDLTRSWQLLKTVVIVQLTTGTLTIVYFYINFYSLTPALLRDRKHLSRGPAVRRLLLILLVMLVSVMAVKVVCFYFFLPATRPFAPPHGFSPPPGTPLPPNAIPFRPVHNRLIHWSELISSGISFSFAMLVSSLFALIRSHTLGQQAQQQMALEKVSAELAVLKLQVSPHFLFNTLNNIRWLARKKSDQTEAAVVTLAQLLRYMIYQAQQGSVSLRQEAEHIQHYIDLQRMRLRANQHVSFHCSGETSQYSIEPLLFIPFVENAFKYGLHSQLPSHIFIRLTVENDRLIFTTENSTFTCSTEARVEEAVNAGVSHGASGIGITNVRKRLALHYPQRHNLRIVDDKQVFRVELTVDISHDKVTLPGH